MIPGERAASPHIVIVGGGFGGLAAARALVDAPVSITLVDRSNHHLFQPLLYQVAMAALSPAEIAVPIRSTLHHQRNVSIQMAEVRTIELGARQLTLDDGVVLAYDFLVLAAGAEVNYYGHPEWRAHAPGLKRIEDALEIRRRVLVALERAEREVDPARRRQLLTFVVIGGGPTGVELAGAIGELAKPIAASDFRRIDPSLIRVVLLEMGDRVLATFDPRLSVRATEQLQEVGVVVRTGTRVTRIDERGVWLGDELVPSSSILWTAGVRPSRLAASLGVPLDRTGRVLVGSDCAIPGHPEVFAIGDVAAFAAPGGDFLPGVSPVAMQQGRYVARAIVNTLRGEPRELFSYVDKGSMATIGRSRAVAQIGKLRLRGLPAWLTWLFVHLWYLIGFRNRLAVFINWCWSYVTFRHGARLITGGDSSGGEQVTQPEAEPALPELRVGLPGVEPSWQPKIGDYAIIGDCRTAALVSRNGSVDWLCWPRFDAPSLFAALLDRRRGGRFGITPVPPCTVRRRYLPDTNVLETTFDAGPASLVVTDFMPVADAPPGHAPLAPDHELLRVVEARRGDMAVEVTFDPRPGWGLAETRVEEGRWGELRVECGRGVAILRTDARPLPTAGRPTVLALRAGQRVTFSLTYTQEAPAVLPAFGDRPAAALEETVRCWRSWVARSRYEGPYSDAVRRSALTVKLLCYAPSGAVVAAPTTSLPERLGGDLNWDYRYCWLRDAALTVRALLSLGHDMEASAFADWLLHATRLTRPRVLVLYDVFGVPTGPERTLDHLEGYGGARPVRVGNAAAVQHQLDVYGEVVEAALALGPEKMDRETRAMLLGFGRYIAEHWEEPDAGIWEVRGPARRHTTALALGAVALGQLAGLTRSAGERQRIEVAAARIRQAIETRSWSESAGTYLDALEDGAVDASLLLLPIYGYCAATGPRMRATTARVLNELGAGPGLVYRNRSGRLPPEGAFGICSFWAVEALARGAGSLDQARRLFEQVLSYANDVGLYAEQIDPATGDALGNFPQGFTHVGLINAALALEARAGAENDGEARP